MKWPKGDDEVYVHVVTTRVRKLYRCQVVIVRQSLEAPLSQARYWASSDLQASPELLLAHIAARWDIEVLFGDDKEELGLDQYQLMSATACNNSGNAMSPLAKPGARSSVAIVDMCSIGFMGSSNPALNLTPSMNSSQPERGSTKKCKHREA